MRVPVIALAGLLSAFVATQAAADAPRSVVALLGPSLGHLMAQNDICGWNLGARIEATYKAGFTRIGLTAEQQAGVWDRARWAQKGMLSSPDAAKARMKAEMCTPEIRARIEQDLAD